MTSVSGSREAGVHNPEPGTDVPSADIDACFQYFNHSTGNSTHTKDVADGSSTIAELNRLRDELQFVKRASPFRTAEMALEIQMERFKVMEISNAREAAVQRLADAYASIRLKNEVIEKLQHQLGRVGGVGPGMTARDVDVNEGPASFSLPEDFAPALVDAEVDSMKAHIVNLETTIEDLRLSLRQMQQSCLRPLQSPAMRSDSPFGIGFRMLNDPPPRYELGLHKVSYDDCATQTDPVEHSHGDLPESNEDTVMRAILAGLTDVNYKPPATDDPAELVKAREELLASIPLPDNPPDPTLSAIIIPPPFSLHEFLNTAPGPLRTSLANYKILHNVTTHWCPEREEHGYMYVPVFKCSTNPRIATAHRWSPMDVIGRMSKPTECFYNKEGVWYYAGSYRAFRLDDLSTTEWAQLSNETISAIVKETIAARKNSSPQNTYETTQLYAAGALKVACVGLQCVGFNQEVYRSMIEHSIKFSESKWKAMIQIPPSLGTPNSNSSPLSQTGTGCSMSSINSLATSGSAPGGGRARSPAASMTPPLLASGMKPSPGLRVHQGPRPVPSMLGSVAGMGSMQATQACTPVSSPANLLATPASMSGGASSGVGLGDSGGGMSLGSSVWNGKAGAHGAMMSSAALGVLQNSPTPLRGVGMSKLNGGVFENNDKH